MLQLETRLSHRAEAPAAPAASAGADASAMRQTMWITDGRGKLRFETRDYYVPFGTEVRYDRGRRLYVLADPRSRAFWALPGAELATLLEGGPRLHRTGYSVTVDATEQKQRIAGFDARRSDARLRFAYSFEVAGSVRRDSVEVRLAIWHATDPRLPSPWARTLIALIALPFQDDEGWRAVEQIAGSVGFPLRWSMRVTKDTGAGSAPHDALLEVVTTCTTVKPRALSRRELTLRPADFAPARQPYAFGPDGQTVSADVLSHLAPVDAPTAPDASGATRRAR